MYDSGTEVSDLHWRSFEHFINGIFVEYLFAFNFVPVICATAVKCIDIWLWVHVYVSFGHKQKLSYWPYWAFKMSFKCYDTQGSGSAMLGPGVAPVLLRTFEF